MAWSEGSDLAIEAKKPALLSRLHSRGETCPLWAGQPRRKRGTLVSKVKTLFRVTLGGPSHKNTPQKKQDEKHPKQTPSLLPQIWWLHFPLSFCPNTVRKLSPLLKVGEAGAQNRKGREGRCLLSPIAARRDGELLPLKINLQQKGTST